MRSFFSLTRRLSDTQKESLWIVPDFNFLASPPNATSWQVVQSNAKKHDSTITNKIPKLAWRGVVSTNAALRGSLLEATSGKEWADVQVINWNDKENFMDVDDFCRYTFLVHTEGISYSSRLKHLLNCNSITSSTTLSLSSSSITYWWLMDRTKITWQSDETSSI